MRLPGECCRGTGGEEHDPDFVADLELAGKAEPSHERRYFIVTYSSRRNRERGHAGANHPAPQVKSGFIDVLQSAMDDMQQLQGQADATVGGVLAGNGSDVHRALLAVENAALSFQRRMQVRNKIDSAYEEISRMQF